MPPGSALGPVLFIAYIKILLDEIESLNLFPFTDDNKLFRNN